VSAGFALQEAMRQALLAHAPLTALLMGQHVYETMPHGVPPPYVMFATIETRDWSVADHKGHEHFVSLEARTNQRSRKLAQDLAAAIETALDGVGLALAGHTLVNLRLVFWTVARDRSGETYNAVLRFRAATEVS
jgi:hypothetical protein